MGGEKCRICDNCRYVSEEDEYFCDVLSSYVDENLSCEEFKNHESDYFGIDLRSIDNYYFDDGWY